MSRRSPRPLSILGSAVLFSSAPLTGCANLTAPSQDAGALEPAPGDPCSTWNEAAGCQAKDAEPELICDGSEWRPPHGGESCICHPDEDSETGWRAACAVPGFIGLDRAGRSRVADVTLRRHPVA